MRFKRLQIHRPLRQNGRVVAGSFRRWVSLLKVFLSLIVAAYLFGLYSIYNRYGERTGTTSDPGGSAFAGGQRQQQQQKEQHQRPPHTDEDEDEDDVADDGKITIGVASTVTGCGSEPFVDGAAVLKYSLDVQSRGAGSRFRYKNYVMYHPDARECVLPLEGLGYTLLERPTPIKVEEIGGDGTLRERIVNNGCCGEKELIKLEAFRLVQHPLVIHLDLDVLVNKPMDDVLDLMLNPKKYKESPELLANVPVMWPSQEIPDEISLMFTKDYNVVAPRRADKPYQGGFFVIKPSIDTYNEFVGIVRSGDYHVKRGWGKKVGPFYGGMTIQGLLPYYYQWLHPGRSVELNRCKYNNMSDDPYLHRDNGNQRCRTNEEECEDCRFARSDDVVTFHYTICQKPWNCNLYKSMLKTFGLCREMNRKWYELRSELEKSWGRSGRGTGSFKVDHYNGHCSKKGTGGYQPIEPPYGMPI